MTTDLTIAIVDDHPLFREGVRRSLSELGFVVIAEGETGDDAIAIAREHRPDLLLLDVSLPGGGLAALPAILRENPAQKTVMLTVSEQDDDIRRAFQLGARGYVLKGIGSKALAEILLTVASGERYVAPSLSARLLTSPPDTPAIDLPTERERQVLDLLTAGLSNKRIAIRLGLHEKTIKHHMTSIFVKLKVSNRTEAALRWRENKLEREPIQASEPAFTAGSSTVI
jgi:DNA-binding NarL/FixJ family response regulator